MKPETAFQSLNKHAIDPTDARTRLCVKECWHWALSSVPGLRIVPHFRLFLRCAVRMQKWGLQADFERAYHHPVLHSDLDELARAIYRGRGDLYRKFLREMNSGYRSASQYAQDYVGIDGTSCVNRGLPESAHLSGHLAIHFKQRIFDAACDGFTAGYVAGVQESGPTDQQAQDVLVQSQKTGTVQS